MAETETSEDVVRAATLLAESLALVYRDPRRGLELAVAAAAVAPQAGRAAALHAAAWCAANTADPGRSVRLAAEGLRALDEHDDPRLRSRLLSLLAEADVRRGDLTQATDHAKEALGAADGAGDDEGVAFAVKALGNVHYFLGDYVMAATLFEVGSACFARAGNAIGVAFMRGNLGEALVRRGELRAGLTAVTRAEAELRELAPTARPRALLMVADAMLALGDHPAALAAQDAALEEAERQERPDLEALGLASRGWATAAAGRHREARGWFERALDLGRRTGLREAELEALLGLGTAHARAGDLDAAATALEEAGALAASSRQRAALGRAHRLLADVYEGQGAIERAYGHLRSSIDVTELPARDLRAGASLVPVDEILARWLPRERQALCPACLAITSAEREGA